jgi:hypothetical protein
MKNLGSYIYRSKTEVGDAYIFKESVYVDDNGIFRIRIEDNILLSVIASELNKHKKNQNENDWAKTWIDSGKTHNTIRGESLEHIKYIIRNAVDNVVKPIITQEIVIFYRIASQWRAWVNAETNNFWANGGIKGADPRPPANWMGQGGIHTPLSAYVFGCGAICQKKITITRGDSVKTTYEFIYENEYGILGEWGVKLNSYHMQYSQEMQGMPYTEEAAMFFFKLIEGIIRLGISTLPFLKDTESIVQAISDHAVGKLALPGI